MAFTPKDWINETDHAGPPASPPGTPLSAVGMEDAETRLSDYTDFKAPLSVKEPPYNATGDGATNDTTAIQAAIDAVEAAGGGLIYFPPGDYVVNGGLTVDAAKPIRLLGAGMGGLPGTEWPTRLVRTSGTTTMLTCTGTAFATRAWVEISDMQISGGSTAGKGIVLTRCQDVYLHRLRIADCNHTGLQCTQLFNSSGSDLYIHACGNGTTNPAWLFDAITDESSGASNTCLFTNLQFEGNGGTDLKIDGNQGANATAAAHLKFANVKMEAGTGAFPYINLAYAESCGFSNVTISNAARTVIPVQQNHPSGSSRGNSFSNMLLEFTGGSATYAIEMVRQSLMLSNLNVVAAAGPQPSTAAVHVSSTCAAGDLQLGTIRYNGSQTVDDDRAAGSAVASGTNIILPAGERFVHVSGTTTVNTIAAEENGRVVTLVFSDNITINDTSTSGGNIILAGNANMSGTGDDTLTLACDVGNWYQVASSVN